MKDASLLDEFLARRAALEELRASVEGSLRSLLHDSGAQVQFVSSRVKSPESLARKLARPDKTYARLTDVTDLVGVRIATYFEDSIDEIARLIEGRFAVDYAHSADKLRFTDHGRFGYRSLHYVCAAPRGFDLPDGLRFEVQVRTALQHAWAEVEHDLGYKAEEHVPEVIRRRFSRIASLLEIADQEFVSIRADLRRYREQVRAELLHPTRPLPLDVISLGELVTTEPVRALDDALGVALSKRVVDEPWNPDYLVPLLKAAGITTTRDTQDAVSRLGARAVSLVGPYFAFAKDAWDLDAASLDAVQRGYSLFFVAHAALVDGEELGISKVAKVAGAYRALDGLDERTAQKTASGLVAALSR